ncbi:hypothetical protein EC957_008882 [Mortierella hygrophila]|uniref:Uncharacterized protein n=1 Tax=Mortierella hygrophila TaxID=979708 RepID=A0A9P6EWQ0_9FUNG|nr:hypothetical protein EC957_008882 [Mortierella hygrophila]
MAKFTFLLASVVVLVGATVTNAAAVKASVGVPTAVSPMCYKQDMWLDPSQLIYCGDNCTVWNNSNGRARYLQPDVSGMVDQCRLFAWNNKGNVGAFQFARFKDNKSHFSCVKGQKGEILCKEN